VSTISGESHCVVAGMYLVNRNTKVSIINARLIDDHTKQTPLFVPWEMIKLDPSSAHDVKYRKQSSREGWHCTREYNSTFI
jgi:hypothetical protein